MQAPPVNQLAAEEAVRTAEMQRKMKVEEAHTKQLIDFEALDFAATQERLIRLKEGLKDLERRMTDIENVVSDQLEVRSAATSFIPKD